MFALHGTAGSRFVEAQALAGHPPMTLMRRAGTAVARLVLATARPASPVLVLTGAGHNGGDGWVAALRLHAQGWPVHVWEVLPARAAEAQQARAEALAAGVAANSNPPWGSDHIPHRLISQHGLTLVDALLGLGARDGVPAPVCEAIRWANQMADIPGVQVVAVDLPSGLDTDSGRVLAPVTAEIEAQAVAAHHTLSLLTLKPGLFTAEGRTCAGRVWFDDLRAGGVPRAVTPRAVDDRTDVGLAALAAYLVPGSVLRELWRHRVHEDGRPRTGGHKGRHGDAWLLGGAPGMGGALMLAARAALAAGAGRVHRVDLDAGRVGSTDPIAPEVMTPTLEAFAQALARALKNRDGAGSVVTVAGCGGGAVIAAHLAEVLHRATCLVLDADALNALAADASLMARLAGRARRGLRTVLTPHPLEAARMLGCSTAQVQANRLNAAQDLADRAGCTVVLKGAGSIVASAGQLPWINSSGNARLASGGTGDVLAGWIGGAWACRGDPQPCSGAELHRLVAACVHLHGRAADSEVQPATAVLPASDLVTEMARELMRAAHGHQG